LNPNELDQTSTRPRTPLFMRQVQAKFLDYVPSVSFYQYILTL
jgi:hypothetical protein